MQCMIVSQMIHSRAVTTRINRNMSLSICRSGVATRICLDTGLTITQAAAALQAESAIAQDTPITPVLAYLEAMEARQLDRANALLADAFVMQFPGARCFRSVDALIPWAAARYSALQKRLEALEAIGTLADGVVYVRGRLDGRWPDGTPFRDVRFIDRFDVADGLLLRQDVWNDLAELRTSATNDGEAQT